MDEILRWVLHIVQVILVVMALGLFTEYRALKFWPYLIAAVIYGGAAVISFMTSSWWPVAVAFVLTWVMKLLGLDPANRR